MNKKVDILEILVKMSEFLELGINLTFSNVVINRTLLNVTNGITEG